MQQISSEAALEQLIAASEQSTQLIFKMSMTCAVSPGAYKQVQQVQQRYECPVHLVIVQTSPEMSALVEARLGVRHESPQLLILAGGRAVWQATHYLIKAREVGRAIETYGV